MVEAARGSGPVVVQKYGGSSVADVERLRAVARRVVASVQAGERVVVVVSAMGNTTNELLALARSVSPSPGRRELDLLVSVGERVSMTLLAMAIQDLGVDAVSFTGSQSGIITDERHVAARVLEVRPHRVAAALGEGKVAIVAGFQGVSRSGEVTTLGRGGSDTTAVVLAAALGAERCEICSDVDGVWSADPRVVPGAHKLDELPLDAGVALAQHGAQVLLAEAVERAREWGVRLHAAATHLPPGSGTRLPPGPAPAAALGVTADVGLVALELPPGPWRAALAGLPGGALRQLLLHPGARAALLDVRNLSAPPAGARPVATVTVVGRMIVAESDLQQVALDALDAAGLPVEAVYAAGERWTAVVAREHAAAAQRALHAALVEPAQAVEKS
ncbi:MAG: aspartate kinase [Deltaproteobacteria bacterium]|nr:aspartate kinase [Deltaproteobacteria bacterium]